MSTPSGDSLLHALVICISKYQAQSIQRLPGAIKDRDIVLNFLNNRKPRGIRKVLCDKEATREKIIKALKDFGDDRRISVNDPILIHYSGHGVNLRPVGKRGPLPPIVGIVPFDARYEGHRGKDPIPDYTIGALLQRLAALKGENVVRPIPVEAWVRAY
jgi:hypothetical protein